MPNINALTPLIPFVTGAVGAAIAWSVYRLGVIQRQDAWLRTLWDFHRAFWQDEKMERVRAWIACDAAYREVQPILFKRVQGFSGADSGATTISIEEYKLLESVDRFGALLSGYTKIAPDEHPAHRQAKQRLYDTYWTSEISMSRRPELRAYLERFFPELFTAGGGVPP